MITDEKCKNCGHEGRYHHIEDDLSTNGPCYWRPACCCEKFVSPTAEAVAVLPFDERELLACANYLGIDPRRISKIEITMDGGGHYTGLNVVTHIPISRHVSTWVNNNIPKEKVEWVTKYLAGRVITKVPE